MPSNIVKLIRSPVTLVVTSTVVAGSIWGHFDSNLVEPDSVSTQSHQSVVVTIPEVEAKTDIPETARENKVNQNISFSERDEAVAALAARIDTIVSKNVELEQKLAAIESSQESFVFEDPVAVELPEPSIPFSPEALEREARIQNEYIDSVEAVYHQQEENIAWASQVETLAMEKLVTGENAVSEKAQKISGIALENFNCKSQLCNSVFVADSLQQLIEYQNHIINEMVYDLPSVVFGPAESFGNKHRMRVMLASDNYEFPTMPAL